MRDDTYIVNYQPEPAHLNQIQDWMIAENREGKEYRHDISVLQAHLANGTFVVLVHEGLAIGFATWSKRKRIAYLHHTAIKPQMRRKHLGELLIEDLFAHLRKSGLMAIYLMSVSEVSEKFWKSTGFQELPELPGYSDRDYPYLCKTLIDIQDQGISDAEYIQVYPYGSDKIMSWPVIYRPGTKDLIKPIIAPVSGDWCIEHVKTQHPEYPNVVKRFRSGECLDDLFLIITTL